MELYLAKLLGLYFIIIGIIMLLRRRALVPIIGQLMHDKALLFVVAVLELAAGIGLTLAYPFPGISLSGILSFIGYLMVVESIMYLTAPVGFIRKFVQWVNRPNTYLLYAPCAMALGVYLAGLGFGHW